MSDYLTLAHGAVGCELRSMIPANALDRIKQMV